MAPTAGGCRVPSEWEEPGKTVKPQTPAWMGGGLSPPLAPLNGPTFTRVHWLAVVLEAKFAVQLDVTKQRYRRVPEMAEGV
jgi:hypothetical protein